MLRTSLPETRCYNVTGVTVAWVRQLQIARPGWDNMTSSRHVYSGTKRCWRTSYTKSRKIRRDTSH